MLHNLRAGQIIVSHLYFDQEYLKPIRALEIRHILIIRDPRDVVISQAYYFERSKQHFMHDIFVGKNLKEQIKLAIRGYPQRDYLSTSQILEAYSGWLESDALVVRFEDLVGSDRIKSLSSIYDYIGVKVGENFLVWLADNIVSRASPTFRTGRVGQWRQIFDDELLDFFAENVPKELLMRYGYTDE